MQGRGQEPARGGSEYAQQPEACSMLSVLKSTTLKACMLQDTKSLELKVWMKISSAGNFDGRECAKEAL